MLACFLPDNRFVHHMTEERHFNWLFFPWNAQFTLFLCSKWPAPDLKQLIITIITHIVQQSPSFALLLFCFFSETASERQQRASTISKHNMKKGKTNLIAISRYWIQERRQTFKIIMVNMLRRLIIFLSFYFYGWLRVPWKASRTHKFKSHLQLYFELLPISI